MANLSSLNFRLSANIAPFRKGLNKAERSMDKLGRKMQQTGKKLSMRLTAPIAALGAISFNVFKDFELEMAKVKAVSGATAEEFKLLSDNAKELGRSTIFTAREVAGLQLEFAKLGFTAKQIESVTEATLNLAQASGSDLAQAAQVAGSTLRGFNLDVNQTKRVTDVMAKSFASSGLDINTFADAMSFVGPVAAEAGMSIEETSAMLGILANSNIRGSKAGTAMRRIISEIGASGKPTAVAIKELADKGLDLTSAMDEVGRSAQTALVVLAGKVDEIAPLTKEFENSAGAAKTMADIMDMTAAGATKALGSAVEGLAIEFGGLVSVALTPLIGKLTQFALFVNELPKGLKIFIAVIAGLTATIGPAMFVLGSFQRILVAIRTATWLSTAATTAFGVAVQIATSPITLIVLAVAALAAALVYLGYNFKTLKAVATNAIAGLVNSVLPKINTLLTTFNAAAEFFGNEKIMVEPFEKMKMVAVPALKSVGQVVNEIKDDLGLFKEKTEETTKELGKLPPVINEIKDSTNGASGSIKRMTESLVELNSKGWQILKPQIAPVFASMKTGFVNTTALAIQAGNAFKFHFAAGIESAFDVLEEGETRFGNFLSTMLSGLKKLAIQFMAAAIAAAALAIAVRFAIGGAAGIGSIGDIFGTMQSVAGFMPNIPMLAEGGIVSSPTLAMIGEGGQSEAVIPLDRLGEFGGGGQNVVVTGRISGADILLSNERASRTRTRQRGF